MKAVLFNRDFSRKLELPVKVEVERYSWHMVGGPWKATLIAPVTADRWELMKLLRCPVEIRGDGGHLNWWGYVNRVTIPQGIQRFGIGLDNMFNYVIVRHNAGETDSNSDTNSLTEFGQKEYTLRNNTITPFEAAQVRDLYLEEHKYPRPEIEFSGGTEEIQIECYGWYSTLAWQQYTNTDTDNVENTAQIQAIVTSAGQFFNGVIIDDTSGFTSNEEREGRTALTHINELLYAGTDNVRPLLTFVDESRYLHVYERDPETTVSFVMREDGRLENLVGVVELDEYCTVGKWVEVKGKSDILSGLDVMRPFFIESAEYVVSRDKTTYRPAGAYEQNRLEKFIEEVVTGEIEGAWGHTFVDLTEPDLANSVDFWAALGLENDVVTRIHAFHRVGDNLYVGGSFSHIGGVDANNIAVFNLATFTWSALEYDGGNGTNNVVYAIEDYGVEHVYFGGSFTDAGGLGAVATGIVEWSEVSRTWSAVAPIDPSTPAMNGTVFSLLTDFANDDLYVGGNFADVDGDPDIDGIARLDITGVSWNPLDTGLGSGSIVYDMVFDDTQSNLYVVGSFTAEGNRIASWDGAAWSNLGTGLNNVVRGVTYYNNEVYVVGDFTTAGGSTANYFAKWTGSAWEAIGSGLNDVGRSIALVDAEGDVQFYIGGDFTVAGGVSVNKAVRWDGANFNVMGSGLTGGDAYETYVVDSFYPIYGGDFGTAGGKWAAGAAIYFRTIGSDLMAWLEGGSSAVGHPGGPDTAIQFNNGGEFGGEAEFRWEKVNNNLLMGTEDPPSPGSRTIHQVQDNASPAHLLWAFGTSVAGFVAGLRARGTVASPTAVQTDDILFRMRGRGQYGTAAGNISNSMAYIQFAANENWDASNQGARTEFWTTPDGSTTPIKVLQLLNGTLDIAELAADPGTAGSGRWGIYAKSDGIYYIDDTGSVTGPLGVGGGGGTGAPGGSDTYIQYNSGGSFAGDDDLIWDDVNLIIQRGAYTVPTTLTNAIVNIAQDAIPRNVLWAAADSGVVFPTVEANRSRGTFTTASTVDENYELFRVAAGGYDGTSWQRQTGYVSFLPTETWTSAARGTQLKVILVPTSGTVATEVLTIDDGGIDLVTGNTYDINGSPHTHSDYESASESVLASSWTLSSTAGTFDDIGLSVTLPAAGTYLVDADIYGIMQGNTGNNWFIVAKLYNSTDAADVTNSETLVVLTATSGLLLHTTASMTMLLTVAASKTIKVYAKRDGAASPTFTNSQIGSTVNGRTRLRYKRIA